MEVRFNPTTEQTFELEGRGKYNFTRHHDAIEQHMRRTLDNGNVTLLFRVREQTEAPRILTRRELFQQMLQKNEALRTLKEALKLELN